MPSEPPRPQKPYGTHRTGGGGIPDGLLIGLIGFLLGITLFTWTATGLSALFAHGSWPEQVSFSHTPYAMRELVTDPHDLAGAWPDTPRGKLSGYGLFWGIFISQLMILIVLTVFVMGTVARARAVRRARRLNRPTAGTAPTSTDPTPTGPSTGTETGTTTGPTAGTTPGTATGTATGAATEQAPDPAGPDRTAPGPATADTAPGADATPGPAAHGAPQERAGQAPGRAGETPQEATGNAPRSQTHKAEPSAPQPSVPQTRAPGPPAPATAAHATGLAPLGVPAPPLPGSGPDDDDPVTTILEAPGATLVATTDPALWEATKSARAKLGPVHLFDPTHLCDTPDRLRWSPHHHCADRTTAADRAAALLAPLRSPRPIDATTHTTAETLLRCWLHAAALDNKPFREVHRWALATAPAADPVRILRSHPKAAPGTAGELESVLSGHPQLRSDAIALIRRALSPLGRPHVRNACSAERADRIALESFADETGTLYVVGEEPDVLPLLNALAQSVVEHGRRMAAGSSAGRLDPPLTTVLRLPATVTG